MSRELGELGRTVALRPPRRVRWWPLLLVASLLLAAAAAAAVGERRAVPVAGAEERATATPTEELTTAGSAVAVAPSPAVPTDEAPPPVDLPVLARARDLVVHVPARDPVVVSYHEASLPGALPVTPLGELTHNDNPTRALVSEEHAEGLPFHVQVSRGRANGPTSAVDVVLRPGEEVLAPVAGTVTEVRPYQLYGTHDDVRLELRPDDSDLLVVLIHVEDVQVEAGDRVAVGDVLAGGARRFPFGAVVDTQTAPDRHGHVHMEVKAPG